MKSIRRFAYVLALSVGSGAACSSTEANTTDAGLTLGITAGTPSLSVVAGTSGTVTFTVTGLNAAMPVSLSIAGAPDGVTATFDPPQTTSQTRLTIATARSVATQTYPLVVTAQYGEQTASANVNLVVTAAPAFTATLDPAAATLVRAGQPAVVAVRITRDSGFSGPIAVTLANPPAGITAASLTIDPAASSGALTISGDATAAIGVTNVTVRAVSGETTNDNTLSLGVRLAPGTLDTTFGTNGVANGANPLIQTGPWAHDGNGKFVTVSGNSGGTSTQLARYLSDGNLDVNYGTSGVASISPNVYAGSICAQGTGVLVGGLVGGFGVVARVDSTGQLDTSFGTNGRVTLSATSQVLTITLDSTGRIIVGTGTSVIRLSASGVLDSGFGTSGSTTVPTNSIAKIIELTGGSILAVGRENFDYTALKLTSAGLPDMSFGAMGRATIDFPAHGDDSAATVVQQTDGKVVLFGTATGISYAEFGFARLTTAGVLDTTFGTGGLFMTGSNGDRAYDMHLQPNGKIVGVGYGRYLGNLASPYRPYLVRITPSGALDATWGNAGRSFFEYATDNGMTTFQVITQIFPSPDAHLTAFGYTTPNRIGVASLFL